MNEIIFYNDNHWFSPIGLKENIASYDKECALPNVFELGDNWDLANCALDMVPHVAEQRAKYKAIFGNRGIDGNHERESITNDFILLAYGTKKVLMLHGDFESWGPDKAIAYRSKPHGASTFKRLFTKTWNDFYDKYFNNKITSDFLHRCQMIALLKGADLVVVGHKHVKESIRTNIGPIKIIVLARGRNVIDLNKELL